MRAGKRGIAPRVMAVAVLVIVIVGAVAGYVLLTQGQSPSSSGQTSSVSLTSSTTSNSSFSSSPATSFTTTSSTLVSSSSLSTSSSTSTTSTTSSLSTSSSSSSTTKSSESTSENSTSTTSSTSCSTYATPTEPQMVADFATLLGNFSRLSVSLATSAASEASHPVSSYSVVYASTSGNLTTYNVEFNDTASGTTTISLAWLTSAGTVVAVDSGGINQTGAQAVSAFSSNAGPFLSLITEGRLLDLYTSSPQVRPVSQQPLMLGPTSLYVTNFAAISLPASASTCDAAYSFTTFSLQATPVYGTDLILVTQENIQGSVTSGSASSAYYVALQVLSVTEA